MSTDIEKIQEEIVRKEINEQEKMFKGMTDDNTLVYHLDRMTKDELIKVAKRYEVKGLTSLKKAEVIDRVSEAIIEKLDNMLLYIDEERINFIKSVIDSNGVLKYDCSKLLSANFLRNRGLLFAGAIGDELNLVMPIEVMDALKFKIQKDIIINAKNNSEIIRLFTGMIYYYGVLELDLFKELIIKYIDFSLDQYNIEKLVEIGEELGYDYKLEGDIAYHIDVEDEELIIDLRNKFEGNYHSFDKKTLIKASKMDFSEENKQGIKLEKVLGEMFVVKREILQEEIESFSIMIKNEEELGKATEIFLQGYEIQNEEERNILTYELNKLAKSVRKWTLKGYTVNEIENKAKTIIAEVKIGRNDPCTCGSGKKYKKCCG